MRYGANGGNIVITSRTNIMVTSWFTSLVVRALVMHVTLLQRCRRNTDQNHTEMVLQHPPPAPNKRTVSAFFTALMRSDSQNRSNNWNAVSTTRKA